VAASKLFLDVDTGVDDALALGYAVLRDDADLVAVGTLAGNVDVENTTENTRRVLAYVGAGAIPVHRGASRPIARLHRDATHYHGLNGLGNAVFPDSATPLGPDRGPAALIRLARQFPGEITVVAVGPMTNIAIALNVCPDLPSMLNRFVIMGGAYRVPGNVTPHAEFNIWADPEAAEQVFATTFPGAIAVGLDVSHQTLLTREHWRSARSKPEPFAQMLVKVCERSFVEQDQATFALHDPLATAVALDQSLVATARGTISVITTGPEEGRTVFADDPAGNWTIADSVEADQFVNGFLASYGIG
jgi:purine nucleosidase